MPEPHEARGAAADAPAQGAIGAAEDGREQGGRPQRPAQDRPPTSTQFEGDLDLSEGAEVAADADGTDPVTVATESADEGEPGSDSPHDAADRESPPTATAGEQSAGAGDAEAPEGPEADEDETAGTDTENVASESSPSAEADGEPADPEATSAAPDVAQPTAEPEEPEEDAGGSCSDATDSPGGAGEVESAEQASTAAPDAEDVEPVGPDAPDEAESEAAQAATEPAKASESADATDPEQPEPEASEVETPEAEPAEAEAPSSAQPESEGPERDTPKSATAESPEAEAAPAVSDEPDDAAAAPDEDEPGESIADATPEDTDEQVADVHVADEAAVEPTPDPGTDAPDDAESVHTEASESEVVPVETGPEATIEQAEASGDAEEIAPGEPETAPQAPVDARPSETPDGTDSADSWPGEFPPDADTSDDDDGPSASTVELPRDEPAESSASDEKEPSPSEHTQVLPAVSSAPEREEEETSRQDARSDRLAEPKTEAESATGAPTESDVERTQVFTPVSARPSEETASERTGVMPPVEAETAADEQPPAESEGEQTRTLPPVPPAPAPRDQETQRIPTTQAADPPTSRISRVALPADTGRETPERVDDASEGHVDQGVESAEVGKRRGGSRRGLLIAAMATVVVLVAGVVFGVAQFGGPTIAEPPPPVQLRPSITPVGSSAPAPTPGGLEAALAQPTSDPALGTLGGVVVDARSGERLWASQPGTPLVPASTGKLVTTSAALLALDPQHRFTTKVVQGETPGSVVLIGGGDPTLSSLPQGADSVYPGAAHIDDLAAQVEQATGGSVSSITVDTSRYAGPTQAPGWMPEDVDAGFVAPMEPVMVDGGRADPTEDTSPRSSEPALDAARELGARLGVDASAVGTGAAPAQGTVLGQVRSATVQDMVETVLQRSDNVLAEALAREVAVASGRPASFDGATSAVRDVLAGNGLDLTGVNLADGSGLSTENRITAGVLGSLIATASAPPGADGLPQTSRKLRALLPGLPVAGGSGSLAERYRSENAEGRGWVRAKTGTLTGANSLAGTVLTRDGRLLGFALVSNGTPPGLARPALDNVAVTLRECGCR